MIEIVDGPVTTKDLVANGCETHLVLKLDDIMNALSKRELSELSSIVDEVRSYREGQGKNPDPTYLVCNTDEPYAEEVELAILRGEETKAKESEREV